MAICLENPWKDEVVYNLRVPGGEMIDNGVERAIRVRDYASLDARFRDIGIPAAGWTGRELEHWVLRKFGLARRNIFVDNVLRCGIAPEEYPTGKTRREAERHCRQYDRWDAFLDDTTLAVVTIHPAALSRDITPFSLQIADFKKARDFSETHKVIVLAGGKSAKMFLGYAEGVLRWRGHYAPYTLSDYKALRERQRKETLVRVKVTLEFDDVERDCANDAVRMIADGNLQGLDLLPETYASTCKVMKPRKPKRATHDARQSDLFVNEEETQ